MKNKTDGYQPDAGKKLDVKNPPRGGSGVPAIEINYPGGGGFNITALLNGKHINGLCGVDIRLRTTECPTCTLLFHNQLPNMNLSNAQIKMRVGDSE